MRSKRAGTSFVTSADGVGLAYQVDGAGPPVILLHGGGHTRRHWHDQGYVERLRDGFTVITMDIRGNGESDRPTDPASYATERLCADILAVADVCGAEQFAVWGFSYGGNIGRYLASRSPRVASLIMVGIPFGPGASGDFRQLILELRNHWEPILQAQAEGTLDDASLTEQERHQLASGDASVTIAWLTGMLDWPAVEPGDLLCPTLWLVGSENEAAMENAKALSGTLRGSAVRLEILDGLDHFEEFTEIDRVFPVMRAFTESRA